MIASTLKLLRAQSETRGDVDVGAMAVFGAARFGVAVRNVTAPEVGDGAAAVVLAEGRWAEKNGLEPLARVTGYATAAMAPGRLFEAPERAIGKLLERTQTSLADYDLLEINEAFSAQILANGRALGWNWERVNVHGGAIALGHPLGATGARIVVTLLNALRQLGFRRGLAGLCHGGGGAVAMSFEVV